MKHGALGGASLRSLLGYARRAHALFTPSFARYSRLCFPRRPRRARRRRLREPAASRRAGCAPCRARARAPPSARSLGNARAPRPHRVCARDEAERRAEGDRRLDPPADARLGRSGYAGRRRVAHQRHRSRSADRLRAHPSGSRAARRDFGRRAFARRGEARVLEVQALAGGERRAPHRRPRQGWRRRREGQGPGPRRRVGRRRPCLRAPPSFGAGRHAPHLRRERGGR